MKAAIGCFIGLVLSVSVGAESLLEGRVRLDSGEPVADAQVRLFDLTDLRRGAIARAMTDGRGYFALPLTALAGRALPARFALGPNYPNPFNPSTIIPYQLAASAEVRLEVFNLLGQRITTLVDGERAAGFHTATWHATDGAGRAAGAGVYIYRMTVGVENQTGRMVLIDGQAGLSAGGAASAMPGASGSGGLNEEGAQVYGLIVSGSGLVPYVDSSFRVEAGMAPVELVVSAGPHSAGKITDDDCAFCDLFDALNDGQEEAEARPSGKAQAILEAPSPPTNLRFDAPTDSSCTVRWDASDGATDYDVNYKPAVGGRWTNEPHRGIGLSNTIDDLQPNTEYRWAVRAENSEGTSEWIHGPNFTTLPSSEDDGLSDAPTSPTNLRFDAPTDSSCTVRWDAADGATDYDVNYKPAVGGRWTIEPHRGIGLSNTIDDLQPNTEYRWAVRAENNEGTSEWIHGPNFTTLPEEGPDLIVQSPSVSAVVLTPGQEFTLQVTVHNQGDEQAAATMLHYYRSNNSTITSSDTEVGTDAIDALDASATSAASIALTAPTGVSAEVGIYYGACVASVSGESDTDNNCSSAVKITVNGQEAPEEEEDDGAEEESSETGEGDLIVSASVNDNILATGQAFILRATVQNQGTDESPELVLSYYRSSNATISTQDTQVGTDEVGSLAASSIKNESIRLTAPSTPGTYYYGACVASVSDESDTPSNCSSGVSVIVEEDDGADGQDEELVFTDPQIYNDNVFVLPVEENLAAIWTESGNSPPLQDYTARFYEHFSDEFDFLIFVANVPELEPGGVSGAFFHHVKNDVQGIGLDTFSDNSSRGSAGKLQGAIFFSDYQLFPFTINFRGFIQHELMHRWAAFLDEPLSDGPHWNDHTNISGVLGGGFRSDSDFEEIVDLGGGRYTGAKHRNYIDPDPIDSMRSPFVPLELYLAGFIPPEEVSDIFWAAVDGEWLFDEAGNFLTDKNGDRIFSAREIKKYTIDDIIAEHGPRVPNHLQAQKDFRAAVILLVSEDYPATREILEGVSDDALWFSHAGEYGLVSYDGWRLWNFYEATGGRGTITMDDLSHFQSDASAKRLVPSSFGTPPPPIVDIRE